MVLMEIFPLFSRCLSVSLARGRVGSAHERTMGAREPYPQSQNHGSDGGGGGGGGDDGGGGDSDGGGGGITMVLVSSNVHRPTRLCTSDAIMILRRTTEIASETFGQPIAEQTLHFYILNSLVAMCCRWTRWCGRRTRPCSPSGTTR